MVDFPLARFLERILDVVVPGRCAGCGVPGRVLCGACECAVARLPGVVRPAQAGAPAVVALGDYVGTLRSIVLAAKFRRARGAADRLGRAIAPLLPARVDVLVPVPLHRSRLRERGYDQAAEIAAGLMRATRIRLALHGLMRVRPTRPQSGLGRFDRCANVGGVFSLGADARSIAGMRAVLVDDVVTTGATTAECARVLRTAGCSVVCAAAAAVTPLLKK